MKSQTMKSVLIVDDNLVSLKQISAQIAEHYEVSLAKSGALALQICRQERPDLILMDVEMPEMDGFQTIAGLKQDPRLAPIPVIFLTGSNDAATEIRCLESGAVDFIIKPANTEILRRRIALHLEFSAYERQLELVVKEIEDQIGASFAELVECKDFNLGGHVLRTSVYAAQLTELAAAEKTFGDEIGEADVELIRRAAPFHDIGKIGVSDLILLKRGPLTDAEYQEVKQHTFIGGRMLEAICSRTPGQLYLKAAKVIAEGHHERYDGKGYPRGLAGEAIPSWCRIMSVANVYDACITDRIYRKGLSHEEAARIILSGRGTEFDPRLVDVFERNKEKFALLAAQSLFQTKDMDWSIYHETNSGS